jgi:HEPN domain-containing protein
MKPDAQRWVERAESDLFAMRLLSREEASYGTLFHAHQALEKLLKALLLERMPVGPPPRTHNLVALADRVGLLLPERVLGQLTVLNQVYAPDRYPDIEPGYMIDDMQAYVTQVEEMYAWLRQYLT